MLNGPICASILRSLNKQYAISRIGKNPNFVGDLFLKSDLEVRWHRKFVMSGDQIDSVLDYASVDIANDGHRQTVYRAGGPDIGGPADTLVISTISPADLPKLGALNNENLQRLLNQGEYVHPNEATTPEWKNKKDAPSDLSDEFYFNIVELNGTTYLLAMPHEPANTGDAVAVYVLKYVAERQIPMLCHFHGAQLHDGGADGSR